MQFKENKKWKLYGLCLGVLLCCFLSFGLVKNVSASGMEFTSVDRYRSYYFTDLNYDNAYGLVKNNLKVISSGGGDIIGLSTDKVSFVTGVSIVKGVGLDGSNKTINLNDIYYYFQQQGTVGVIPAMGELRSGKVIFMTSTGQEEKDCSLNYEYLPTGMKSGMFYYNCGNYSFTNKTLNTIAFTVGDTSTATLGGKWWVKTDPNIGANGLSYWSGGISDITEGASYDYTGKLNEINNSIDSVNNSINNVENEIATQNEKDDQDRANIENQQNESDKTTTDAESSTTQATASLIDTITSVIGAITGASARGSCVLSGKLNENMNENFNVDLCGIDPPPALIAILNIPMCLVIFGLCRGLYHRLTNEIEGFTK